MEVVVWAAGAVLVLLGWWLVGAYRARLAVYALFDVDANTHRLLASDLGGRKPMYLRLKRLVGAADAVFVSRRGSDAIVGEYKSRAHQGFIRRRERYQVILYMGMLKHLRGFKHVRGVIRYADRCVPVPFDEPLFNNLLALAPEYQKACARWRAPDPTPLHQR